MTTSSRKNKRNLNLLEEEDMKCRRLYFDEEINEKKELQKELQTEQQQRERVRNVEVEENPKKRTKRVHFASNQIIIEVPNRIDYFMAGIELWWSKYEMDVFYRDSLMSQF